MAHLDINVPNLRVKMEKLISMRKLSGVIQVDGLDVDENGEFTTLRIHFEDEATMQAYLDGVAKLRAQGGN